MFCYVDKGNINYYEKMKDKFYINTHETDILLVIAAGSLIKINGRKYIPFLPHTMTLRLRIILNRYVDAGPSLLRTISEIVC